MSIETFCPPSEGLPNKLKTANALVNPEIEKAFGKPLESVKAPSCLDQVITKPEIGTTIFRNPKVVELKTIPQTAKPEPKTKPSESVTSKTESPKQEEYVDGPIFAFGVGAYKKLYDRYIEFTSGDTETAKKYTRMAILNDSTPFIQEYFADAKDKNDQYIIKDHVMRAQLAHTPTKNEYIITTNPRTGKKIITSPEYELLGVSITEFVSGFRRGADKAMMGLVEETATNLPSGEEGEVTNELIWSSSRSQDWEGYWINKYCGKYGYKYKGSRVLDKGKEKLVVYSYKVDSHAQSHLNFQKDLGGETFYASFEGIKDEDKDSIGNPREVDVALRTLTLLDRPMQDKEIISRSYAAKEKVERSKLMFNLDEGAMQYANNPFLRDQIEAEVSTKIADWLVDQIISGQSENFIQNQIESKFTEAIKNFTRKKEQKVGRVETRAGYDLQLNYSPKEATTVQELAYMDAFRRREVITGGFCGDIGGSSDLSDIGSSSAISFVSRSGGFMSGGGGIGESSSGLTPKCIKCRKELCEGRCFNCEKKSSRAV